MRLGIAPRITALSIALVAFTAGTVGWYSNRQTRELLVAQEWVNLEEDVRDDSAQLKAALEALRADTNFLTVRRITQRFTGIVPLPEKERKRDYNEILENSFEETLRFKPQYIQMRLIGKEEGGREVVRVTRDLSRPGANAFVPTKAQQLEQQGEEPYVRAALALPRGQVYLSDVRIESFQEQPAAPQVAVLHASAPVFKGEEGHDVFGVVVIDIDFDQFFQPILKKTRGGAEVSGGLTGLAIPLASSPTSGVICWPTRNEIRFTGPGETANPRSEFRIAFRPWPSPSTRPTMPRCAESCRRTTPANRRDGFSASIWGRTPPAASSAWRW